VTEVSEYTTSYISTIMGDIQMSTIRVEMKDGWWCMKDKKENMVRLQFVLTYI
jgi:hypothetical protein